MSVFLQSLAATPAPEAESGAARTLSFFEALVDKITGLFKAVNVSLADIVWAALCIVVILVMAKLLNKFVSFITRLMFKRRRLKAPERQVKRIDSVLTLLHSVTRYVIYIVAVGFILSVLGLGRSVNAMIATAGIGGLAIGFGAQNLVRDVVTGLFLMFENQYSVGDYIQLDTAAGTVEAIAVRVTYLRGLMGEQYIIPNGSVVKVINYTRGNYTALVDVTIAYKEDTETVMRIMQEAADAYCAQHGELIIDPARVIGVLDLSDNGVVIRTVCHVVPLKQYEVERGLRLAFKMALMEHGIELPFQHRVVILAKEPANAQANGERADGAEEPAPERTGKVGE